jgi:sialate O-acetylesterase
MLRRVKLIAVVGFLLTIAAVCLHAEIKLPTLLSDGMVLQQGVKANLWGTADPGERVTVSFNNQQANVVAGNSGQWSLKLGPLSPGGPFPLTITGKNEIILHDV